MIPFIWNILNRQICTDRKQKSGCHGLWGGGNGEGLLTKYGVSFWDENVLELNSGDVLELFGYTENTELYTLKW